MEQLDFDSSTKSVWDKFTNSHYGPFLSFGWHELWWKTFGSGYKPLLLQTTNGCLVPLALNNNVACFSGGKEIADYLDMVGPEEKKSAAWEETIEYLRTLGITKLELFNLPSSSQTISFFKDKTDVIPEDTTPKISLPPTWDEYLEMLNGKDRHELKRKVRKFEREFPGSTIINSSNKKEDMTTLLSLMKLNPNKAEFLTTEIEQFFRSLVEVFTDSSELLLLKVGERTAGATFAFTNSSTMFLYNSGFDETNFSGAGFYLKVMGIKRAIEGGKQEYNFLQGNERYKYELGGQDFGVFSINYNLK